MTFEEFVKDIFDEDYIQDVSIEGGIYYRSHSTFNRQLCYTFVSHANGYDYHIDIDLLYGGKDSPSKVVIMPDSLKYILDNSPYHIKVTAWYSEGATVILGGDKILSEGEFAEELEDFLGNHHEYLIKLDSMTSYFDD